VNSLNININIIGSNTSQNTPFSLYATTKTVEILLAISPAHSNLKYKNEIKYTRRKVFNVF